MVGVTCVYVHCVTDTDCAYMYMYECEYMCVYVHIYTQVVHVCVFACA